MKRTLPAILAVLLLFLAACQPSVTESSAPSDEVTVPVTSPEAPDNTPVLIPADDSRSFFVNGCFLGAWSDGQWRSAHDAVFTVGELFNQTYYGFIDDPVGAVRFFAGDGLGAFSDPEAASLLEPFGVIEGDDMILPLPAQLTGPAADLAVPNYNFWACFDGQSYALISNVQLQQQSITGTGSLLPDDAVTQALAGAGITCDLSRMDRAAYASDVDGDGTAEALELIQTPSDEGGYAILEEGDPIFYALLLADGDNLTVVTSHRIDYTDDVTSHFRAVLQNVSDLNGDGSCEIILQQMEWEWGHYAAFTCKEGQWTECLRGEYGM